MKKLVEQLENSAILLNKNDPVFNYLNVASNIMIFDNYEKKPYLNTTENEQYMRNLINPNMSKAFVVMGGGDPIFQLLAHNIIDIDAVEINEMQNLIFSLKKAAFKTLNNSEYENFLIDRHSIKFLSKEVFNYVKDGFSKDEDIEKKFWSLFLEKADIEEIKQYFFKGGIECSPIDIARKNLLFIKKKNLYYKIRENIEKAKITIKNEDAVEYLTKTNEKYDYIDITNILLFIYQQQSKQQFIEYIKSLKTIYKNNLNNNGVLVLDYMFGIISDQLLKQNLETNPNKKFQIEIYIEIYKILCEYFSINMTNVEATPNATVLTGFSDVVVYTKK